jgi:hypothetical protein
MKRLGYLAFLLCACFAFAQTKPSLLSVRKIYVDKMDDNLDHYITSQISKQFHGNMEIVLDRGNADAILRGVSLGAQNTRKATVELVDPAGQVVLWSGTAGDRNGELLDVTHGGEQKIAEKLVTQMRKAMQP